MPQPGAQSPPRGGARRRSISALLGQKSVLLVALIAAMAMVLAGCNVLPSAGAEEGDPEATGAVEPGDGEAEDGQGDEGADEGGEGEGQEGEEPVGEEPPADDGQGEDPAGEEPPADDGQGEDPAGEEPPPIAEEPPVEDPDAPPANEGDDPPQDEPDPDANQGEVEEETQDPGQDPCDPAGLPEHNGQQTNVRGSAVCNRGAMGVLPAADKTPSIRIVEPDNGDRIRRGQDIEATVAFDNFTPGLFDDPQTQYGSRPFSIDGEGNAVGHSHLYVQRLNRDNVPETTLDSFLALNDPSDDGTLSGAIPGVDERGRYRICTDISGGNHLTFPKGNAQQGPQGDCIQVFIF